MSAPPPLVFVVLSVNSESTTVMVALPLLRTQSPPPSLLAWLPEKTLCSIVGVVPLSDAPPHEEVVVLSTILE